MRAEVRAMGSRMNRHEESARIIQFQKILITLTGHPESNLCWFKYWIPWFEFLTWLLREMPIFQYQCYFPLFLIQEPHHRLHPQYQNVCYNYNSWIWQHLPCFERAIEYLWSLLIQNCHVNLGSPNFISFQHNYFPAEELNNKMLFQVEF